MPVSADRAGAGGGERALEVSGRGSPYHALPACSQCICVYYVWLSVSLHAFQSVKVVTHVYPIKFGSYRR